MKTLDMFSSSSYSLPKESQISLAFTFLEYDSARESSIELRISSLQMLFSLFHLLCLTSAAAIAFACSSSFWNCRFILNQHIVYVHELKIKGDLPLPDLEMFFVEYLQLVKAGINERSMRVFHRNLALRLLFPRRNFRWKTEKRNSCLNSNNVS
ncbi:uncharacterized protein M6B38_376695 [Iris pallida]|uniref:Uncharacterized protein n=1 Tax=Iris pallida TaxID=29817 RepID=A0AAX6GBC5_IRIPA|nr:uncharacterized protein M6B38_376695 [Iris pallida]